MKYALTAYLLITCSALFSQRSYLDRLYQFSTSLPLGETRFLDLKVVDDSVTVIGEIYDGNYSFEQNLFVARFDTMGQLAKFRFLTEVDSTIPVITNLNTKFYFKNNLFYILGEPFDDWTTIRLFILDRNLNLLKTFRYKIIEDDQYLIFARTPIELDGYIYVCMHAYRDHSGKDEAAILKLDKLGNIIWRKIYSFNNTTVFPIKFYNLFENEISFIDVPPQI